MSGNIGSYFCGFSGYNRGSEYGLERINRRGGVVEKDLETEKNKGVGQF